MSAPEHAKPIGDTGFEEDGKPVDPKELPDVICQCGWKGNAAELLGVDPDENSTLWCPQCTTSMWEYA